MSSTDPLEIFKKRMLMTSGSTIRDEHIKNSRQLLQSTFFDDASANPNITYWKTEAKVKCRIFERKFSSSSGVIAKIQLFIDDSLDVGDVIYDNKEQEYWICTEMFNINDVHKQGKITLCNWILKFQSKDGTILSYPCVDSTTQRAGEKETDVITLGDGVHTIKLPFDENTIQIRPDRRFFLDRHPTKPTPYQVVGSPNTTTYNYGDKGLIVLTLKENTFRDETDRADLGICDYFEPSTTPLPETSMYSIIACSNPNNQLTIGSSSGRTLTPTFYRDDALVEDIVAIWTYELPIGYEKYFTITPISGTNKVKIVVNDNENLLGKTIAATVSNGLGEYVSNIVLTIVSGY